MKALDAGRLQGYFVVALDGTGHLCFREPHCSQGGGLKVAVLALVIALAAVLLLLVLSKEVPPPVVSWQPNRWVQEDATVIKDRNGRRYYQHLVRYVGEPPQKVVMVAEPQESSTDPATFYAMENKVWNDLYAVFMADPEATRLLQKYSGRPGCQKLLRDEWRKGGFAANAKFFGVDGPPGVPADGDRGPLFRRMAGRAAADATAVAQGGRLGRGRTAGSVFRRSPKPERSCPGPDRWTQAGGLGKRDVSNYGCRQMASNGYEWTRDLADEGPGGKTIPLEQMKAERSVAVEGQSYLTVQPLTSFRAMAENRLALKCTEADKETTFRIVLVEQ